MGNWFRFRLDFSSLFFNVSFRQGKGGLELVQSVAVRIDSQRIKESALLLHGYLHLFQCVYVCKCMRVFGCVGVFSLVVINDMHFVCLFWRRVWATGIFRRRRLLSFRINCCLFSRRHHQWKKNEIPNWSDEPQLRIYNDAPSKISNLQNFRVSRFNLDLITKLYQFYFPRLGFLFFEYSLIFSSSGIPVVIRLPIILYKVVLLSLISSCWIKFEIPHSF